MINLSLQIYKIITKKIEFKISFLYLFMGTLFIGNQYLNQSYLEIIKNILQNPTYLVMIIFPSFLFITIINYKYFENNIHVLLRFDDRKKIIISQIVTSFLNNIMYYLEFMLIFFISINLTKNTGFYFDLKTVLSITFQFLKILSMIFLISLLYSTISHKISKTIALIITFSFLLFIFCSKIGTSNNIIIDFLNPYFHLIINNNKLNILSDILYYLLNYLIMIKISISNLNKNKMIGAL
ncbi:MAG: hypothetical protein RSB77_01825 [Bacilli bacterium]